MPHLNQALKVWGGGCISCAQQIINNSAQGSFNGVTGSEAIEIYQKVYWSQAESSWLATILSSILLWEVVYWLQISTLLGQPRRERHGANRMILEVGFWKTADYVGSDVLIPGLEAAMSGAKTSAAIGLNCEKELLITSWIQALVFPTVRKAQQCVDHSGSTNDMEVMKFAHKCFLKIPFAV